MGLFRRARTSDRDRDREEERRHQENLEAQRRAHQIALWVGVGTVVVAVLGIGITLLIRDGGSNDGRASTTGGGSTAPGPTPGSDPNDTQDPTPGTKLGLGCPDRPKRGKPAIRIRVVAWCAIPGVRGQVQIKVKVRVSNEGRNPLDIRRTRFRLLVRDLPASKWSPPKIGAPSSERPTRVTYDDNPAWAIPANPDRAYDRIPGENVVTFATHWGGDTLRPRSQFEPLLSDRQRGVLVFYYPVEGEPLELEGVLGLAYMAGRKVVALCPPEQWLEKLPANEF